MTTVINHKDGNPLNNQIENLERKKMPKSAAFLKTRLRIMRPGQDDEIREIELARDPGYHALRAIIAPILEKGALKHVSVLADFDGGTKYKPLDMFVDDCGLLKNLPRNKVATVIYRRANQMGQTHIPKVENPDMLNYIVGTAVLFDRRVWF